MGKELCISLSLPSSFPEEKTKKGREVIASKFIFSASGLRSKMMVVNSFDLWQKDQFFSAAEEVQGSADTMESAYGKWIRERRKGVGPEELDELCSELQTALGTAKWQLEEFERAVRLSSGYGSCRSEGNATIRHKEFISALEDKISCVETALRESFRELGKQPFSWVNLDKEECEDLTAFLCGYPLALKTVRDESVELSPSISGSTYESNHKGKEVEHDSRSGCSRNTCDGINCCNEASVVDKDGEHIIDIEAKEASEMKEDIIVDRTTGARKIWVLPKFSDLKIVVPGDVEKHTSVQVKATPKEKGYKPPFWKLRCFENSHPHAKGVLTFTSQLFRRAGGLQRLSYSHRRLQLSYIQFMLVMMLTIFLIVPFLVYTT